MTTQPLKQGSEQNVSHVTQVPGTTHFVVLAPETVGLPESVKTPPEWFEGHEVFPLDVELDDEMLAKLEAVVEEMPEVQEVLPRFKEVQAHLESLGRSLFAPGKEYQDVDFVLPCFAATREGVHVEWFVPQESWFAQQLAREF